MKKTVINALFAVTIVGLVSAIAVAVTWALSKQIGTKTNTFTSENDITTALYEPWWNQTDVPGTSTNATANKWSNYPEDALGLSTPTKGETLATGYTPNRQIPKNPVLYNSSDKKSEWLAMRVVYKLTFDNTKVYSGASGTGRPSGTSTVLTVDYENFSKIATVRLVESDAVSNASKFRVSTDNNAWSEQAEISGSISAKEVFYYNSSVATGGATTALFDVVQINAAPTGASSTSRCKITGKNASGTDTDIYLDSNGWPQIDIELQGFAVDATSVTVKATAHDALKDLVLATCYPS